jgi:hypothetical protein
VSTDYDGQQYVGIDLHRRGSVIVRMTEEGDQLDWVRIDNDPVALGLELAMAGPDGAGGHLWLVLSGDERADAAHDTAHRSAIRKAAYRKRSLARCRWGTMT